MTKKTKNIKCKSCGKVTPHYLLEDTYRCIYCNTANKTIQIKDIIFEPDFEINQETKVQIKDIILEPDFEVNQETKE